MKPDIDAPVILLLKEFVTSNKPVRVRRVGGETENEADHFTKCECGGWVDMRDLEQVLEHVDPHERSLGDH